MILTPAAETNWMVDTLLVYASTATLRAGLFSVAPVAFGACGGYTVAVLLTREHMNYGLSMLIAVVAVSAIAALLAAPLLRLSGIYAALATLAMLMVAQGLASSFSITGGSLGLYDIPSSDVRLWLAILVLLTLACWYVVDHTFVGRQLDTIAENSALAAAMCVPVPMLRLSTLVYSAALSALAGGFYVRSFYVLSPGVFAFPLAVSIAALAVIGGAGYWLAPFASCATIGMVPVLFTSLGNWTAVVQGGLMSLVVMVYPDGIAGVARKGLLPARAVLATDRRTRVRRALAWL